MARLLFGVPGALLVAAGLLGLLPPLGEAGAAGAPRLFVLQQAAGGIVEYDLQSFQTLGVIPVPPETFARDHPILVSHLGQVLISLHHPGGYAVPARHWLWDGRTGRFLVPRVSASEDADGWAYPRGLLSADGREPFWYATTMPGTPQRVTPTFHMFRGAPAGPNKATTIGRVFPECECTTGACSESCPVGEGWAPHGVIDDFFFVTYFIPGQLEPSYESTYLFQRRGGQWTSQRRPEPSRLILDAARAGDVVVEAVPDGGCCGWANESSDTTLVRRTGKTVTIFDEHRRYNNERYDVSFYSASAAISPDQARVAHTIASSEEAAGASTGLRLSSGVPESEKLTPQEIAKLTELIAGHPLVEIVALDPPSRPPVRIAKATLIGWLSDREIVIFKDKKLHVADARDGKLVRTLPMTVGKPGHVFLR